MASGETIVGDSTGYSNTLPKKASRGPDKSPLKKQVSDISVENQALKDQLSEMRGAFVQLQQQIAVMMQQQQAGKKQSKESDRG